MDFVVFVRNADSRHESAHSDPVTADSRHRSAHRNPVTADSRQRTAHRKSNHQQERSINTGSLTLMWIS